ncbi:MAG: rhodanese-like domain-containing protein [Spirochaetia bacterium]|nr:rhodanese-like domain-containing protein [Spirochaetia bacterium]
MSHKIDRETLKKKLDSNEDIKLVEVLMPKPFNQAHIKGAINIPLNSIAKEASGRFNKNDEIVVYCADTKCKASPAAAEKLETFGFTNVHDYEGGKKDWMEAGYPVEGNDV